MTQDFRYINLKSDCKYRKIPDGIIRVVRNKFARDTQTRIIFNCELAEILRQGGFCYLRLRENTLTQELYLVFVNEDTPDSVKVALHRKGTHCAFSHSTVLANYLARAAGIKDLSVSFSCDLRISGNKSRVPDAVVVQVFTDK